MDPARFDELTRILLSGPSGPGASRRRLLAAIATGGLGGFIATRPDLAKARKKKKKCRGAKKRCGDACIPDSACCLGRGRWVADGRPHNQCGLCTNGTMLVTLACDTLDPDGCTECNDNFACVAVTDGTPCICPDCEPCSSCLGGLCESGCGVDQDCCGEACCDEGVGCCGDACCDSCPVLRECDGFECCDEDEVCCGRGTAFQRCCKTEQCIEDRCCLSGYCGGGVCKRQGEQCCQTGGAGSGWACPVPGACCGGGDLCCPGTNQFCWHCNEDGWRCCDLFGEACGAPCTDPVPGRSS